MNTLFTLLDESSKLALQSWKNLLKINPHQTKNVLLSEIARMENELNIEGLQDFRKEYYTKQIELYRLIL